MVRGFSVRAGSATRNIRLSPGKSIDGHHILLRRVQHDPYSDLGLLGNSKSRLVTLGDLYFLFLLRASGVRAGSYFGLGVIICASTDVRHVASMSSSCFAFSG